jgi:hypothetical protein
MPAKRAMIAARSTLGGSSGTSSTAVMRASSMPGADTSHIHCDSRSQAIACMAPSAPSSSSVTRRPNSSARRISPKRAAASAARLRTSWRAAPASRAASGTPSQRSSTRS